MTFPDILLEDDVLVAFDKPGGLPVSPDPWEKSKSTLMGIVRRRYGETLANVHRLEADASGVVLCAKTKPALDFLSGQFQSKTVRKLQNAMVVVRPAEPGPDGASFVRDAAGALPPEFSMDLALGQDEKNPGRVQVFRRRGGKPGITDFRVLESFGRFAWLECRPLTGRKHQVRVHLAAAGAPVLNDALYGLAGTTLLLSDLKRAYKGREAEKPLILHLALHAGTLGFIHPQSREPLDVVSPLPKEFEIALKYLRKFAGARTAAGNRA
jgi:23S rRNA pseudouridine1911/1915/1917 synthase